MKARLVKLLSALRTRAKLRLTRQFWVYMLCLLVSCAFWALTTLSKNYNTTLYFPINYTHLPEDKIVAVDLPESLAVEVNSFGFNLLWYKMRGSLSPVDIKANVEDMKSYGKEGKYYIATVSKINEISRQLDNELTVRSLRPDTIFFKFSERTFKKVPVKVVSEVSFDRQFQLSGSIETEPAEVMVSGPKSVIDTITAIFTDKLSMQNIAQTIEQKITLHKPNIPNVEVSVENVEVTIPVEKFTEGATEVPILVSNLPEGHKMKLFPEKVELKYLVPLNRFDEAKNTVFKVYVDYMDTQGGSQKLRVTVKDAPSYVNSVRVIPETVEYIIQK